MHTKLRRVAVVVLSVALALDLGAYASGRALGLDRLPDVESVMRSGLPNDTLIFDRTGTVLLAWRAAWPLLPRAACATSRRPCSR